MSKKGISKCLRSEQGVKVYSNIIVHSNYLDVCDLDLSASAYVGGYAPIL